MTVKEFTEQFIEHNSLVRLWTKVPKDEPGLHKQVLPGEGVIEEWKLIKSEYANYNVIGVTDILVLDSNHKEAVNLVITDKLTFDERLKWLFNEIYELGMEFEIFKLSFKYNGEDILNNFEWHGNKIIVPKKVNEL